MKLSLHLLGAAEIHQAAQMVASSLSAKARALLYYLAVTQDFHTRTHLANLLWSDFPDDAARANLRKALSELGEHFESHLLIERQAVGLSVDAAVWVDAVAFVALLDQANQRPVANATIELIQQALALYRGDFLAGFYVRQAPEYEAWMLGERAKLRQAMVQGLEKVASHFASSGDLAQAVAYARRLLELEPWHEESHRRLMAWLARDGQRSAALAQYELCRTVLAEELSVAPSQATQQLYAQLQRQDRAPAVLQHLTTTEFPLIGRKQEWQTLLATWHQAQHLGAHVLAIVGEAGVGKTRLAEELLMYVQRQGHATASTRAYPLTSTLPYGPVAGWLRSEVMQRQISELNQHWLSELTRLLPELRDTHPQLSTPTPLLDHWQHKQFFAAINQAFTASGAPLLLLLDEIQWVDRETLVWLPYFLNAATHAQLLLVVTLRPEEVEQSHPLHSLWRTLTREGCLTTIQLPRLNAVETTELATEVIQQALSEEAAANLYQETAGNPLFIIERLRNSGLAWRLADLPAISGEQTVEVNLPPKVLAVLEARLAQLSAQALALAQVMACVGRACRVDTLVEASRQDEEIVVASLDELWQRRLVQEVGVAVYDFSHEHIRAVAYNMLSPARRRLCHRHVAEALQTVYATNLSPIVGELSFHYEQAGLLDEAVAAYQCAAAEAKALYAYVEVVNYLERAVATLHLQPTSTATAQTEIDLLHELGVVRIRTTGWGSEAVGDAWQRAYDLAMQVGTPFQQCRARHALDAYHRHRGEWQQACEESAAALAQAQAHALDDPFPLHNLLASHGVALYHTGQPAAALDYLEQALALCKQPLQPSFAWFATQPKIMGLLRSAQCLWMLGRSDEARARVQRAMAEVPHSAGHAPACVSRLLLLDFSAMFYCNLGDVEAVQRCGDELIELGTQHDFGYFVLVGRMYVAWALAQQGDVEVGLHLVRESVASLRAQGVRMFEPCWRALLADLLALAGHHAAALHEVEATLNYTAQSANRVWHAHLLKRRGDFLHALAAPAHAVEQAYQQALAVASAQGAHALEVRTTISLSLYWQQQGRATQAHAHLTTVLAGLPRDVDTPDLAVAQQLLDELAGNT